MFKCALLFFTAISASSCKEARRYRYDDPFAILDYHTSQPFANDFLWPWGQFLQAAAVFEPQGRLKQPKIVSDDRKTEFNIYAKRYKPDELRVRVNNENIIVEGKHKVDNEYEYFMANHFSHRFVLPRGTNPEEVTAVLKENGVLTVIAPKHELPPERLVPIEVRLPEEKTEKPEETTVKNETLLSVTSVEQLELTETTTHSEKNKNGELKSTIKETKENEVSRDLKGNGLNYALIESEV